MTMRIGFIGLGTMGKPMTLNLLKAGFQVSVWNRTKAKSEEFAKRGVRVASSPRELAAASDVVMSIITDDAALEAVAFGDDGVLAGLARGGIYIDMSTLNPEASQKVAAAAEKKGIIMLRAPVSGTRPHAEAAKLIIYVSGEKAAFEKCQGIFAALGQKVFYVGTAEEARYLKLAINTMVAICNHMLAEALTFGEKAGLNWDVMHEAFNNTVVTSPFLTFKIGVLNDMIKKGECDIGANAHLIAKDLDLMLGQAKRLEVPMPVASMVRQFMGMVLTTGRGELDYASLFFLMEELAGIKRELPSPSH